MSALAVLGAGAFGTALAIVLSRDGTPVTLWCRDVAHARSMEAARENTRKLPGVGLPDSLTVTATVPRAETVLLATPMQTLGGLLAAHPLAYEGVRAVACCKGVDRETLLGPSRVIARFAPGAVPAVLTGPSFAGDIARGLPTALTLAAEDARAGAALQVQLSRDSLRLYLSDDPVGAELGGALKNVMALAAGIAIGAGLGDSARAALVTRGFAEMQRLAVALGAHPQTLSGLSGLGDLILTCTSGTSRNFSAGLMLGEGQEPDPGATVEGIDTARAVARLAKKRGIDAPLTAMVAAIVDGELTAAQARELLLSRPLRKERP